MSRKWMTLIIGGASLMIVACATGAMLYAGSTETPAKQTQQQPRSEQSARNLSLQPEAFRMSRRLGARFKAAARGSSIATGTLIVGTNQQAATIIRRQSDKGESVDIVLAERTLTWTEADGVRTPTSSPTAAERLLAEQVVLDSADQFILAQLRGAAYYAVARNVRADIGGSDSYTGPLWDLIRIEEPGTQERAQPLSTSRLYYINYTTLPLLLHRIRRSIRI